MTDTTRSPDAPVNGAASNGPGKTGVRLPTETREAIAAAAGDVVVVDPKAGPLPELIRAERHPLDDVLEAALDEWQASAVDQRTEGAVVRSVLADPQHRWLVTSWLQDVGLNGGGS
jgi:hypothetical protein